MRDRAVSMSDWCDWLMWRSDGQPAAHPTFALVLCNYVLRSSLQKQGRVAVSLEGLDPHLTVEDFMARWGTNEGHADLR